MLNRKNTLLYFLILQLFCFGCSRIDGSDSKTQRIIDLQKYAEQSSSTDSIRIFLDEAETIIKSDSDISDSLKAENSFLFGKYFRRISQIDSAAIYFHRAADFVTRPISNNRELFYFIGAWNAYFGQNKYGDCFSISEKFRSLIREGDYQYLEHFNYMQEIAYDQIGDYQKALLFNKSRIKANIKNNKISGINTLLISQAKYRYYLSDKAGAYNILDSLIGISNRISNIDNRQLYLDYGVYLRNDKKYKDALMHYLISLNYMKEFTNDTFKFNELATSYMNVCDVYIQLKSYNLATVYLDSVAFLGLDKISSNRQKDFLSYQLQLASLTKNDIKKVNDYLNAIYDFQSKEYENKYTNELAALTISNEKQQQIQREKRDLEIANFKRTVTLLGLLVVIFAASIFLYKRRKLRFEKKQLQMQQRLLRAQMNPHFTFNSLSTIQNYIGKDHDKATNYLLKFSRLLRLILENSMQNYVELSEELELLEKYMDLQLLRFPSQFTYRIITENFEKDDPIFIPPMLLQPFIENSIEHGFSGIDYTGEIKVVLNQKNDLMECVIEDNGVGLKVGSHAKKTSASIYLIKNYLKKATKSEIEIINKADKDNSQSGVITKLLIPIKLTEND